ncbi:MAG: hypothetical protein JXX28_11965 [Deltaproteobacteria bacterium]|nr:hypothetical protein [Deltaproteobacteria bacterium]
MKPVGNAVLPAAAQTAQVSKTKPNTEPPQVPTLRDDAAVLDQVVGRSAPPVLAYTAAGRTNATQQTSLLQSLVGRMFQEQGLNSEIAVGGGEVMEITQVSPEQAQALIAEDGYWGADQTSDRIVEFAKGMIGGDPARAEEVRAGLEKGFSQAKEAFGGTLPEVSEQTIAATLSKFDELVAAMGSAE